MSERTAVYVCDGPEHHRTERTVLGRPPEVISCRALIAARTECSRDARLVKAA